MVVAQAQLKLRLAKEKIDNDKANVESDNRAIHSNTLSRQMTAVCKHRACETGPAICLQLYNTMHGVTDDQGKGLHGNFGTS